MAFIKQFGFILLLTSFYNVKSDDDECNVAKALNVLLTQSSSANPPSIQLQALRSNLLRRFQEKLWEAEAKQEAAADYDDDYDNKRSFSSLAKTNNLPYKRNLEALARAGYIKTATTPLDEGDFKRSIASLAKTGQLPPVFGDVGHTYGGNGEIKRGIESLARNGELRQRREIQAILDELESGRDLSDLKRNIASIARESSRIGKRNLGSIKAQQSKFKRSIPRQPSTEQRNKREAADYYDVDIDEEYPPLYKNQNMYDYEDLLKSLSAEKRFLGRLPQMNPKTTRSPKTRFH